MTDDPRSPSVDLATLPTPPSATLSWEHQARGYAWARDRRHSALHYLPGYGKTLVAVNLLATWTPRRALVLCPVSVLGVWRREIARHHPDAPRVLVLEGPGAKRAETLTKALRDPSPLLVATNYESVWRAPLATVVGATEWGALINDEVHRCKAPAGKASKYVAKLAPHVGRVLQLTGTPAAHSPLDLWAQARALGSPINPLGASFTQFKRRYAIMGGYGGYQVTGWRDLDGLAARVAPWAHVVNSGLDLPEITDTRIDVALSPAERKAYEAMRRTLWAEVQSGEVTAANAAVRTVRLAQITSGHLGGVMSDDDWATEHVATIGTSKADALADLLADLPEDAPVVVFCRFRHDLAAVETVAAKAGRDYLEVSGARKDLDEHACIPEGFTGILGAQAAAGGIGVDYTRARVGVWYSVGYSLEQWTQCRARIARPGQLHPVAAYHLVAPATVDEAVYTALSERGDLVAALMAAIKGEQ